MTGADLNQLTERLEVALAQRERLLADPQTTVARVFNSAADGIDGLVLERLGDVLVAQLHEGRLGVREPVVRELCAQAAQRLGAGAVYGSLNYHLVRAEDGVHLVPKVASSFDQIYVDVRKFGPMDWSEHRGLAVALVRADKEHLIGDTTAHHFRQSLHEVLNGLTGSGS